MSPIAPARHRSTGRPTTALSDLAATATGSFALVARRSAVVAASSSLIASMFGAPASAAPSSETSTDVPAVDTSALTASARAVLDLAPAVTVPAVATWSFDQPELAVVADPPPVTRPKAAAASRAAARAAVPADPRPEALGAAAPASANGSAVIEIASRYVGVPYRYGGTTPDGFDCSGFTSYVFAQLGISLPRTSSAQRGAGTVVSRADAMPGDLVWHPGHIGIYAGDNMLVHSPQPGGSVEFTSIYFSNPVFIRLG